MKKSTIWILAVVMAIAFVGLLCIQIFYMRNIVQIRYEQFAQGVRQSLVAVSMRLEQDETRHYLQEEVAQVQASSLSEQLLGETMPRQEGVSIPSQHRQGSKPT